MKDKALERDYQFDNIRALLIFLVVFGHMLEPVKGVAAESICRCIYSFHMPAFLFISGYFAKYNPQKILGKIFLPYVLFQVVYRLFIEYVLIKSSEQIKIQFTSPTWVLWYLMALFFFYLLLPLFKTDKLYTALTLIIILVFISLISGFDSGVNSFLSFSRTLVFLPFFIAGNYTNHFEIKSRIKEHRLFLLIFSASIVLMWEVFFYIFEVPIKIMYASENYGTDTNLIAPRFMFLCCATYWILFLLTAFTDKKIPFISKIGQNTISIFLLHAFIVSLIIKNNWLQEDSISNIVIVFLVSAAMTGLLSLIPVNKMFDAIDKLIKNSPVIYGKQKGK